MGEISFLQPRWKRRAANSAEIGLAYRLGDNIYENYPDEKTINLKTLQADKGVLMVLGKQPFPHTGLINAAIFAHHNELSKTDFLKLARKFQSPQFQSFSAGFLEAIAKHLGKKGLKAPPTMIPIK